MAAGSRPEDAMGGGATMLKVAICGLGRWGGRLIESVKDSDRIRFVTAVTRDPARHSAFADQGLALTTRYDEVLADPSIGAIVLATPHSHHHVEIAAAAKAGKHVFVEKPFTLTAATARQAVEACRAASVTLWLGFNRRFAPARIDMLRRINAGEIGDVLHIEANFSGGSGYRLDMGMWRANRSESPGGAMTARGVHALDVMMEIAGEVASVFAFSERRKISVEVDDVTTSMLRFAGGATSYLGSLHATAECWRVQAFGSQGWLEMRSDTALIARGLDGSTSEVTLPAVDMEKAELEAFADAVARGERFLVPPDHMVNGIAVLEAIVASAAKGEMVRV